MDKQEKKNRLRPFRVFPKECFEHYSLSLSLSPGQSDERARVRLTPRRVDRMATMRLRYVSVDGRKRIHNKNLRGRETVSAREQRLATKHIARYFVVRKKIDTRVRLAFDSRTTT